LFFINLKADLGRDFQKNKSESDSWLLAVHYKAPGELCNSLSFFIQLYQTTPSVREGNGGGGQKATDGHIIEGYCGVLR